MHENVDKEYADSVGLSVDCSNGSKHFHFHMSLKLIFYVVFGVVLLSVFYSSIDEVSSGSGQSFALPIALSLLVLFAVTKATINVGIVLLCYFLVLCFLLSLFSLDPNMSQVPLDAFLNWLASTQSLLASFAVDSNNAGPILIILFLLVVFKNPQNIAITLLAIAAIIYMAYGQEQLKAHIESVGSYLNKNTKASEQMSADIVEQPSQE